MSMTLLLAALGVFCAGALAALLLGRSDAAAKTASCLIGAAGSAIALAAGVSAVLGDVSRLNAAVLFPFASCELLLDRLSGLFVAFIAALALVGFIYGLAYFDEYEGKTARAGFFMNGFVASMLLVIVADNVFWFLVAFELMSLTSYFLVIIEENENSIRGGWLYFVIAHVGFVLIMASFLFMSNLSGGSFSFSDFRAQDFGPVWSSACFLLAFFGFGAKAGIIPLHSWLPKAHPEAPSNVSALMSGGMIKIGIFGILKVGLDLLQGSGTQLWWGIPVLVIGAVSSVLGVAYALGEHDVKRLLAYHSVENIGIILLGVGATLFAAGLGNQDVATLALMAALFHSLNHAMFKGELFLGAGAVLFATGTRDMCRLGGLIRRLPRTGVCFLVGALAISAIPPLNGFVSEWYIYQALFNAATLGDRVVMALAALAACALAITGALAAACFVKAYGMTFLSKERTSAAAGAREVPAPMVLAQGLLALACVALGLGAPLVAPVLTEVAASVLEPAAPVVTAAGAALVNEATGAVMSTPVIALVLVIVAGIVLAFRRSRSLGAIRRTEPWACGYAPDADMPVMPRSFAADVAFFVGPLYTLRDRCTDLCWSVAGVFSRLTAVAAAIEPVPDRVLVDAPHAGVTWLAALSSKLEGGDYGRYIVYIVCALVVFLALAVTLV
ncbi:MAG: hydrogenase 4 subunit B [Collinsella sp.]|nr:hydrogenase 4 subunit B [Collinsella sp.]